MSGPSKREQRRAMTTISRWMGRIVNENGRPVGVGDEAFRQGTGITVVPEWNGPGAPAIVGEGGIVPYEWTYWASSDLGLRSDLAELGLWIEPSDGCTVLLYRLAP